MIGAAFPRRKRLSLPGASVPRIDWTHPLTRGLVASVVFTPAPVNIVGNSKASLIGAPAFVSSPNGPAINVATSSQGVDTGSGFGLNGASFAAISIIACFVPQNILAGRGDFLVSDRVSANHGAAAYLTNYAGSAPVQTGTLGFVLGGIVALGNSNNVTLKQNGVPHTFGWSYSHSGGTDSVDYYFDGASAGSATAATGGASASGDNFQIGVAAGVSDSSNGYYNIVHIFNRTLSAAEGEWLTRDPYAFLIFPEDDPMQMLAGVASGGGGIIFNDTINEAVSLTDSYVGAGTFNPSLIEIMSLSDSLTAIAQFSPTLAEALSPSDSYSGGQVFSEAISEAVTLADQYAATAAFNPLISETISPSDAYAALLHAVATLAETVAPADDYQAAAAFVTTISEMATLGDSYIINQPPGTVVGNLWPWMRRRRRN